jgi:hypothetical protein
MFTSGHMFNSIRHTPYTQPNGRGGFNYIAGGFQNQFGIETQIIASICILLIDYADFRWIVGFHDNGVGPQSSYNSRSQVADRGHICLDFWHLIHLLIPNLHFPHQEWRISIPVIPIASR